jgi:GAF domain-containing protein
MSQIPSHHPFDTATPTPPQRFQRIERIERQSKLFKFINHVFDQSNVSPVLKQNRERSLQFMLTAGSMIGTVVYFYNLFQALSANQWFLAFIHTIVYIFLLTIAFVKRMGFVFRAISILSILLFLGLFFVISDGLSSPFALYLIAFSIVTSMLLGTFPGIIAFVSSVLITVVIGIGMLSNLIPAPAFNIQANSKDFASWALYVVSYGMLAVVIGYTISTLIGSLTSTLKEEQELTSGLEAERKELEDRVVERTQSLERRAAQLEASIRLTREITSMNDPLSLLNQVVELIQTYFNYYHAGIFLIDQSGEYAVLRAATGDAGRQMLEKKHRLRVGSEGIVGYVTGKGIPRIAMAVGEDEVHFKNPLLPQTQSEMSVPIQIHGKMLGALDVQSVDPNAFSDEDVKVIQSIADQIAVTLDKSNQLNELQHNLQVLEESNLSSAMRSWRSHIINARRNFSYRYRQAEQVSDNRPRPEANAAIKNGETVVTPSTSKKAGGEAETAVAVPIKLRGQVLGVINLRVSGHSVPMEMLDLINITSDRLALALDNARLLEDSRDRAEREHMISEITTRIRESSEVEKILRTTAQELGQKLGVSQVQVQLHSADDK